MKNSFQRRWSRFEWVQVLKSLNVAFDAKFWIHWNTFWLESKFRIIFEFCKWSTSLNTKLLKGKLPKSPETCICMHLKLRLNNIKIWYSMHLYFTLTSNLMQIEHFSDRHAFQIFFKKTAEWLHIWKLFKFMNSEIITKWQVLNLRKNNIYNFVKSLRKSLMMTK